MAWNGIESVKCNICGYVCVNPRKIDTWNFWGDCPQCEPTNPRDSVWYYTDGNILHIVGEDDRTDLLNMETLAALLTERGLEANVEPAGNGVATIFDRTFLLSVGPAVFRNEEYDGISTAQWDEVCYYVEGDQPVYVTRRPLTQLADEIVAYYNSKVGADA